MASKALIHIRVDESLKEETEKLFDTLGFNMTTAITMFLKQSLVEQALPFKPKAENIESIQARKDVENGNLESFNSLEEWWKDFENDN